MKKVSHEESNEIIKLVKIVGVVVGVILLASLLTMLMNKKGVFDEGYVETPKPETVFSYDNILKGSVFTRKEKTYYVILMDTYDGDEYIKQAVAKYKTDDKKKTPLYIVDLHNGFNKDIIAEKGNPSAQKAEDLKVKDPTLIKIVNGKNVEYTDNIDSIANKLK